MISNRYQHKSILYCCLAGLASVLVISCNNGINGDGPEGTPADSTQNFSATHIQEVVEREQPREEVLSDQQGTNDISTSRRNAITMAVENASPAIVSITVTGVAERRMTSQDEFIRFFLGQTVPREFSFTNMGSGFIISEDGLVVTNQHLVGSDANEVAVVTIDGKTYEAGVVGVDGSTDLALLKIESDDSFSYVEFSDSDNVIVGEWAIALGNPFGLFEDGKPSVTVGVVSAINRDFHPDPSDPRIYVDMIQTDAAINRGNSGGPLLNSEGRVIGINTFIFTGSQNAGNVGLGFAIPSNRVEKIINLLLADGQVALDYDPGMDFSTVTQELVYRYQLPVSQGLLVTSVNRDGPAFECGVMPGDIILSIGDERVISKMHASALLREYGEGDTMKLILSRNGEQYQTTMLLRKRVKGDVQ